jgi:hypothetical protein
MKQHDHFLILKKEIDEGYGLLECLSKGSPMMHALTEVFIVQSINNIDTVFS